MTRNHGAGAQDEDLDDTDEIYGTLMTDQGRKEGMTDWAG